MVAPKTRLQQHTAAEVATMTPEQAMDVRIGTAAYQRQVPEQTMNDIQSRAGGGVWPNAIEHIGDLTHRMNQAHGGSIARDDVVPKLRSQSNNLNHPYGFEREHEENIESNARFRNADVHTLRADLGALGTRYAAEHRRTPVYNYPTEVAVEAAASLGEGKFDDTRKHLAHLSSMEFGGDGWAEGDMTDLLEGNRQRPTAEHQQGMVDYLRGREGNTPGITRAATSLLGGPPRS